MSGAAAALYSGASPGQLRGPEHDFAWCDELAKWEKPLDTWNNLQLGLRLGVGPRAVVTTTPRPTPLFGPTFRGEPTIRLDDDLVEQAGIDEGLQPVHEADARQRIVGAMQQPVMPVAAGDQFALHLQRTVALEHGRQIPEQQAAVRRFVQPKLTLGPVDDPFEREADQVAERVVRRAPGPLGLSRIGSGSKPVSGFGAARLRSCV